MELHVVIEGDRDLAGQLYRQLKTSIRSGRLAAGARLPPTRLLATQLGLSRKTVSEAYARLTFDKLLTGRVGSGTFVAAQAPLRPALPTPPAIAGAAVAERWRTMDSPLRRIGLMGHSRYEYLGGVPDRSLFPAAEWRRCVLYAMRATTRSRALYGDAVGLPELRAAIARHVAFSRGVHCDAENIIVTNGAQQALDLVVRVLVEPGATVAMEDPGYPQIRLLAGAQGARLVGLPVDGEGLVPDAIPEGTRLVYTTPAHQFPLGMPMSTARRAALLARAHAIGAIVIEDDYDSDFRYEGRPTEALRSLDDQGCVAFVGTFSKVLSPDLRIGYLIAPPALREALGIAKHLTDAHTMVPVQRALAKFIDDGELARHIRRCHAEYALRRSHLQRRFAGDLAPWFELVPALAGFHAAAMCRQEMDMDTVLRLARRMEVGLYGIADFYHFSPPRQGLMLGYGGIAAEDIDPSLDRLRDVLQQVTGPVGQS